MPGSGSGGGGSGSSSRGPPRPRTSSRRWSSAPTARGRRRSCSSAEACGTARAGPKTGGEAGMEEARHTMKTARMEAFSDGVLAIVITIMVLELKVPHGSDLEALRPMVPVFLSYVLSFVYVGIYWNNHHHLLHATQEIGGGVMWANLVLLFCLSLVPVVTAWVGDHPHATWPTALYGVVLLLAGLAYVALERAIIAHEGPRS